MARQFLEKTISRNDQITRKQQFTENEIFLGVRLSSRKIVVSRKCACVGIVLSGNCVFRELSFRRIFVEPNSTFYRNIKPNCSSINQKTKTAHKAVFLYTNWNTSGLPTFSKYSFIFICNCTMSLYCAYNKIWRHHEKYYNKCLKKGVKTFYKWHFNYNICIFLSSCAIYSTLSIFLYKRNIFI